jgi:hypothetical protein
MLYIYNENVIQHPVMESDGFRIIERGMGLSNRKQFHWKRNSIMEFITPYSVFKNKILNAPPGM